MSKKRNTTFVGVTKLNAMPWYCHGLRFAEKFVKDQSEKYKRIKRK